MSRIYAVREDTGRRVLVEVTCDWCMARHAPGPAFVASGWIKAGIYRGIGGDHSEADFCAEHASEGEVAVAHTAIDERFERMARRR